MDKEQLDALRRQVEEDYRLDMAAIDRLQRRFQGSSSSISVGISSPTLSPAPSPIPMPTVSAAPLNSIPLSSIPIHPYPTQSEWSKFESRVEPANPAPAPTASSERRSDELEGSLRTMFSSVRR